MDIGRKRSDKFNSRGEKGSYSRIMISCIGYVSVLCRKYIVRHIANINCFRYKWKHWYWFQTQIDLDGSHMCALILWIGSGQIRTSVEQDWYFIQITLVLRLDSDICIKLAWFVWTEYSDQFGFNLATCEGQYSTIQNSSDLLNAGHFGSCDPI